MTFKEIETAYERLLADAKRLEFILAKILVCDIDIFDHLEQMRQSNIAARQSLYLLVQRKFPKLPFDLKKNEVDFGELVSLLKHYPSFINGNEQALFSLFWLMCGNEACRYEDYIRNLLPIMLSQRIVRFVTKPDNKAMLEALTSAIEKAADDKQILAFNQAVTRAI